MTGITYDTTAPTFTSVSPLANTSVNTTAVGYTLSEAIASGSVVWTVTGVTPDTNSPHTAALSGVELNAGTFVSTILTNPPTLVDGAIYKIEFNGTDAAGNTTQVSVTGITYDTTAPTLAGSTIASNSTWMDTSYASAGNTVTFAITATEPIQTPDVAFKSGGVTVNNIGVTYVGGGPTWTAAYIVNASDGQGPVTMDYTITNLLGNATTLAGQSPLTGSDVTVDTTAPTLNNTTSSVVSATPTKITLIFTETLLFMVGLATTDFVVKENAGSGLAMNSVSIVGGNCVLLMTGAINSGVTVTVDYTAPPVYPPHTLRDFAGNKVASFTNQTITNAV